MVLEYLPTKLAHKNGVNVGFIFQHHGSHMGMGMGQNLLKSRFWGLE